MSVSFETEPSRWSDYARYTLAAIRFFNGCTALLAPGLLLRRLGADPNADAAAVYAMRLFGVRTILVALDLLSGDAATRGHAVRQAPVIHASDAVAASLASRSRTIPKAAGRTIIAISTLNTVLSILIQGRSSSREERR
jgi:hypothetical protein